MTRDCLNCATRFMPIDVDAYLCDKCEAEDKGRYLEEVVIERLTKRMNVMEELLILVMSGSTDLDKMKELSARYKDIT